MPYLPDGYGFTGGVARGALIGLLGDKIPKVRDIDIEGIGSLGADKKLAMEVAKNYMTEKEEKEAGFIVSLNGYMATRDFTINEVFIEGNTMYFSRRAAEDMRDKVIRPTDYEIEDDREDRFSNRLLVRALLMQVDFMKQFGQGDIKDIGDWQWEFLRSPGFHVALGLEKAYQKGIAFDFYKRLYDLAGIDQEDIPEGKTLSGMKRLAKLARHMAFSNRDFDYSNDYFEQDFKEEWEEEDERKFKEWYGKAARALHYKGGFSLDEVEEE